MLLEENGKFVIQSFQTLHNSNEFNNFFKQFSINHNYTKQKSFDNNNDNFKNLI